VDGAELESLLRTARGRRGPRREWAWTRLLQLWNPYLKEAARRWRRLDQDEAYSAAMRALAQTIVRWRRRRGSSFRTHLNMTLHGRLHDANDVRTRIKRGGRVVHTSFSQTEKHLELGEKQDRIAIVDGEDARRIIWRRMARRLDGLERRVVRLRVEGHTYSAISKRLRVPVRRVAEAVKKARRILITQMPQCNARARRRSPE